jgi:hypothetical protein
MVRYRRAYVCLRIMDTKGFISRAIVLVAAHAVNKGKGQIFATAIAGLTPCIDASGACLMADYAPAPKYFFVLTPVLQETPE